MRRHTTRLRGWAVGSLLLVTLATAGCGPREVVSAFCAEAETLYDAAGSASEQAMAKLFLATAERDRTPIVAPPDASGDLRRTPEHVAAAARVSSIEEEIRGHLERFAAIVEERPECFSAAERADARRLRRGLDAEE